MAVAIPIRATGGDAAAAEFRRVGDAGERALQRIRSAAQPASASLRAIDAASREVLGGLEQFATRLGPAGAVLQAMGPAGAAAAAGIGVLSLGLAKAVREVEQLERAGFKIDAVLRATGQSSGQTAQSIEAIVQQVSLGTLATEEGVREAATQLLTFRSVAGQAFGETLKLAQDLAAAGFGTLSSNAVQLGKALEDPEQGLTALRRVGVSFTQSQRDLILSLKQTGDEAAAQAEILAALRGQVGGAGEAEAQGLAGAFDTLTQHVDNFFEILGKNAGLAEGFSAFIRGAADAVGALNERLDPSLGQRLAEVNRQIAELSRPRTDREDVFRAADPVVQARRRRDGLPPLVAAESPPARAPRLDELEAERERLMEQLRLDREFEALAKRRAEASAQQREQETRLAKEHEEAEKRAKEAAKERAKLLEDVEKAVQRAREAQIKATEALAEQVQGLREEKAQIGLTERERAIRIERLKAEETARRAALELTDEQAAAVRREAGALFDARKAAEARRKAEEEATRAAERAASERKRLAEREAEEIARTVERTADRIVDFGADAFDRILQGGRNSWKELAADLLGVMRRAFAQIAAEAVIRPLVQPIVGDVLGGVLSGGGAAGSPMGAGIGLGDLLSLGSLLSGGSILGAGGQAAIGNLALSLGLGRSGANALIDGVGASPWGALGGIAANLLFKDLNPVGSTLGGIAGSIAGGAAGAAGLGTILGSAAGPVGAVIGSFLGSALGGKLGGGKSVGPIGHTNILVGPDGLLRVGTSGVDNGASAAATVQQAEQAVARLNALAQQVGGTFKFPAGFFAGISQGAAQGPQSAEAFIQAALGAGALQGANPKLIETALAQGFDAAAQSAAVAGAIEDMLLSLTDPTAAALKRLEAEHEARLAAVKAAGGDIVQAEKLYALQREQVLEQSRQRERAAREQDLAALRQAEGNLGSAAEAALSRAGGAAERLAQARLDLALGPDSTLSPGERLAAAREESARLASLARGGDFAAADQATRAAQAAIGVAREVFAGGPGFAQVFREENARLAELQSVFQREQEFLIGAFGRLEGAARETTATLRRGLDALQAEVQRLRAALEARAA